MSKEAKGPMTRFQDHCLVSNAGFDLAAKNYSCGLQGWSRMVKIIIVGLYETHSLETSLCAQTTVIPLRDTQIIP